MSSRGSLEGRVPSLRFPSFEGEWKCQIFGSAFDFIPNNTLSRSELTHDNGSVKNIHYGDVLVKFGAVIDFEHDAVPFIVNRSVSASERRLRDGDVVIADTAEDEAVGKASEVVGLKGAYAESGLHTMACRPRQRFAPRFMGYCLNSTAYHHRLLPLMQGIKVFSLSKSQISKTEIYIPCDEAEQRQIADFLSLIDSRIAAQRKLVALLKKQKRGLLKEIFERSAEGEYKSFCEIAIRRSEKVAPTKDSELDCIELEHIEPDTGLLLGRVQLRKQDSLKNLCKPNDIVFGKLRPYLRKFLFAKTECAVSSETWVLTVVDGILPRFLFYLIQSGPFMQAANVSSGTKMPRSEWSNVANAKFHIPNAGRQLAIANCLSEVDSRIHQTQRVISAMEVYKRGLLQALFV